jgi:hypothetical protein
LLGGGIRGLIPPHTEAAAAATTAAEVSVDSGLPTAKGSYPPRGFDNDGHDDEQQQGQLAPPAVAGAAAGAVVKPGKQQSTTAAATTKRASAILSKHSISKAAIEVRDFSLATPLENPPPTTTMSTTTPRQPLPSTAFLKSLSLRSLHCKTRLSSRLTVIMKICLASNF